jgi:hypothetical protein
MGIETEAREVGSPNVNKAADLFVALAQQRQHFISLLRKWACAFSMNACGVLCRCGDVGFSALSAFSR